MKKFAILFGMVLFCASVVAQPTPKSSVPKTFDGGIEFTVTTTPTNLGESTGTAKVEVVAGTATSFVWYDDGDNELLTDVDEINDLAAGDYYVVVGNAASCTSMFEFTISVEDIDPPTLALTSVEEEICFGEEVVITATPDDAISYRWYNNGILIDGATTTNELTISNLPVGENNITASLERAGGWSERSNPIQITVFGYPEFIITDDTDGDVICGDEITYTITVNEGTPEYTVSLVEWSHDIIVEGIDLIDGRYNAIVIEDGGIATFRVRLQNPPLPGEQVTGFTTGYIVVDRNGCYER